MNDAITVVTRLREHFAAKGITYGLTWSRGARIYTINGQRFTLSGAAARFLPPRPE